MWSRGKRRWALAQAVRRESLVTRGKTFECEKFIRVYSILAVNIQQTYRHEEARTNNEKYNLPHVGYTSYEEPVIGRAAR